MSDIHDDANALSGAADAYLAASFLHILCFADMIDTDTNMALAIYVSQASDDRKQTVIAELTRVGAIEHIEGTWIATEKGLQIDAQLARVLESRST